MPLDTTTSITLYGVPAWDEGAGESFGRLGASATRTLLCRWADRFALVAGLRGGGAALPAAYPDAAWLVVDAIDVEGIPGEAGLSVGPNGMVAYAWARLKIVYRAPEYDLSTTGSLALDFSAEAFAVPGGAPSYQYADGTAVPPESCPSLRRTTVTFVRTRRNLATLPTAAILGLADCVNAAAFEGAAAGTVKFDGAASQRRVTSGGDENWDVTYKFVYRPGGWNAFFRPSTGAFEAVTSIGGGSPPYPAGDFGALFA